MRARVYLELAKRGYRQYSAYTAATLAGLFTNLVFGLLRVAVIRAVFESAEGDRVGGFTLDQAISYVWLTQGLLMVVQIYGSAEIAQRVRSGAIATDLLRPINTQVAFLATDYGRAAYYAVTRGLPLLIVGLLTTGLVAPHDPAVLLLFAASIGCAVAVSFLYRFLSNVTAFWLVDYRGVALVSVILANLLSGFIIPVSFFPDWLRAVAAATPFPAMIQLPIDIFTGRATGLDAVYVVGRQLAWIVALLAAGHFAFARGRRRLVFQGG